MTRVTIKAAFIFLIMSMAVHAPSRAQLTVSIAVPTSTEDQTVFIAGTFNNWNPGASGYELTKQPDGRYAITLPETVRGPIEFKFTLGAWESVETTAAGGDVANRGYTVPPTGVATYTGTVAGWKSQPGQWPLPNSTTTPGVSVLDPAFYMPQLGRNRRVWIYLPPDYATANKTYPVLYMHDGQNVFDAATSFAGEWGVDETLDSLHAAGDHGIIVVAIDNGGQERPNELIPWYYAPRGGGLGDEYLDFIAQTLKPYIDNHYRTRSDRLNTGIAGSSLGGLMSLYAILKYPDVFGRAGIFSPAFWIAPDIYAYARQARIVQPDPRLYFVTGGLEGQDPTVYPRHQKEMVDTLAVLGYNIGSEVQAFVRPDGRHSEWFWRREFPAAYTYLFGDTSNTGK